MSSRVQSSCPCCTFLNQDLFLPPPPLFTDCDGNPSSTKTTTTSSEILSPQEALVVIQAHAKQQQKESQSEKPPILLVDTHNHAHLQRERSEAYVLSEDASKDVSIVSLTLCVKPNDWEDALKFSAAVAPGNNNKERPGQLADWTLMGIGIHPWYLSDTIEPNGAWKERLDELLTQHPSAIVGEIGLCKMAKCARSHPEGKTRGFEIQRMVLQDQFDLAVRRQRPASVHCVQQHGVFLDMLKDILANKKDEGPSKVVPPAIAMHSFTGTAHHVKQLLQWEASLFGEGPNDSKKKRNKANKDRPPLLYFGFSHLVNYHMCTSEKARRQGREAVRAVPLDRLLAESDVHHPLDVPAGTAGAIAYMALALELPISKAAEVTARNGLVFLQSHLSSNNTQR